MKLSTLMAPQRRVFAGVFVLSAAIDILFLTGSLFMPGVYDRVIPSKSLPTLVGLCAIVAALQLFQALFDTRRGRWRPGWSAGCSRGSARWRRAAAVAPTPGRREARPATACSRRATCRPSAASLPGPVRSPCSTCHGCRSTSRSAGPSILSSAWRCWWAPSFSPGWPKGSAGTGTAGLAGARGPDGAGRSRPPQREVVRALGMGGHLGARFETPGRHDRAERIGKILAAAPSGRGLARGTRRCPAGRRRAWPVGRGGTRTPSRPWPPGCGTVRRRRHGDRLSRGADGARRRPRGGPRHRRGNPPVRAARRHPRRREGPARRAYRPATAGERGPRQPDRGQGRGTRPDRGRAGGPAQALPPEPRRAPARHGAGARAGPAEGRARPAHRRHRTGTRPDQRDRAADPADRAGPAQRRRQGHPREPSASIDAPAWAGATGRRRRRLRPRHLPRDCAGRFRSSGRPRRRGRCPVFHIASNRAGL